MNDPDVVRLGDLAKLVCGELVGDPATPILGAAALNEAGAGQITFIDRADRLKSLAGAPIAAVLAPRGVQGAPCPAVLVDDVHAAFAVVFGRFRIARRPNARGIHRTAAVALTARLGAGVLIGPNASVGENVEIGPGSTIHAGAVVMDGCKIGQDVTIFPNAVLYEDVEVGDRSIIHANAAVGAYGFGYRQSEGRHVRSAQFGSVKIGADVEIGANATVDRGAFGDTRIGAGTKIDNLVQVAHNCQIGRHNLICSQVGIAGSSSTGDYVVIGGQAGIRDHVSIGDGAVLGAMSGVTNDVPSGATMLGIPATPEREQKLQLAALSKLVEMRKEFRTLRKLVSQFAPEALTSDGSADRAA